MPIEMPRGLPFSVDTWTQASLRKRHHFLTHAHRDHSVGIANFSNRIYSTCLTKSIVLQHFPQLDGSLFVNIEVGQSLIIDDPDGAFTVTAFDANHCPGAVMFLFEGEFGNVLHTGDCRLTPECLQNLPVKYIGSKGKQPIFRLDYVFLDCTFAKYAQRMPSKYSAIRQVINCIWKHPDAQKIYLTCDLLGQEEILVEVSRTFGSKIYINKDVHRGFIQSLSLSFPEIISEDSTSRFHLFDSFPKLYERAKEKLEEAKANCQPEPLIIRPSTQWYACEEYSQADIKIRQKFYEAVKDQFGVWHVCYSMHSSKEELEWAMELLAPKWVASTTPNCWAMELDYVKKNCLASKIPASDPLWKILDIRPEISIDTGESCEPVHYSSSLVIVEQVQTSATKEVHGVQMCTSWRGFKNLSPSSKKPNLTLFGRARFSLQDLTPSSLLEMKSSGSNEKASQTFPISNKLEDEALCQKKVATEDCEKLEEIEKEGGEDVTEVFTQVSDEEQRGNYKAFPSSPIGLPWTFNEKFKKLYRSMNVPVPRPLPSLVELNAGRRAQRRF
ncbi:hypothetical protein SAY87_028547 [Trapa incisa]|uniref:DNA repair metallo-beta-lactamase domain-containing protein n=1 Tax=Trapa incisa TaxID=236973 RepID=A0AAN7L001_9MYRT|nr:hypothetical protein SAY87_028547 [Trapa incisa]